MRKFLIGLAVVLIGCAAWLGWPIQPAELGVTAANSAAAVCRAPEIADIRYEIRDGCPKGSDSRGCQNTEHVSKAFLPYALASLNTYGQHRRLQLGRLEPDWKAAETTFSHWNGLQFDVYKRAIGSEDHILVAFRGTDTYGGFLPYPNDFIANLSWLTQYFNPWDQYRMARVEFKRIRDKALADAKGRVVRFSVTGHSLGGGLAKHIARGFPCTAAVVFNSSCVTNDFRFSAPHRAAQIVHVHENRDWLSTTICVPGDLLGWSAGQHIYEANWISDRAKTFADELETTLEQHAIGRMSVAMSRTVLCCVQRERNSSHPSCACKPNVKAGLDATRRMFCEGRKAASPPRANDPCDFSPVTAKNDAQCTQKC